MAVVLCVSLVVSARCREGPISPAQHTQASEVWSQGMLQGKMFMKAHREWTKAGSKHDKFLAMSAPMLAFQTFLVEKACISGHPSFQLQCFKARFFDLVSEATNSKVPRASHALSVLLRDGLPEAFAALAADSTAASHGVRTSADNWLRAPLFHVCVETLADEGAEGVGEQVSSLLGDLTTTIALLKQAMPGAEQVLTDLGHLSEVLKCSAAPDTANPEMVGAALEHYGKPALQSFRAEVTAEVGGQGLFLAASAFLQEAAKDSCGAAKLDLASKKLLDEYLPHVSSGQAEGQGPATVTNFKAVHGMGMLAVFAESMDLVDEALSLWTRPQLERQADRVLSWYGQLASKLGLCDDLLSAWLVAYLAQPVFAQGVLGAATAATVSTEQVALEDLADRLEAGAVEEQELRDFLLAATAFASRLPPQSKCHAPCAEIARDLEGRLTANSLARKLAVQVLELLSVLPERPASTDDMVQEWKDKVGDDSDSPGFLAIAVEILEGVEKLRSCRLLPSAGSSGVGDLATVLKFSLPEVPGEHTGSVAMAMTLLCGVPTLKTVENLGSAATASLQTVFEKVVSSCRLGVVKPVPDGFTVGDTDSAAEALGSLLSPDSEAARVASSIFSPGLARHWACEEFALLLETLVSVVPGPACWVSLAPLSRPQVAEARVQGPQALSLVVGLFTSLAKVALTTAFLGQSFILGTESCVAEHALRPDVEAAVQFVKENADKVLLLATSQIKAETGGFPTETLVLPPTAIAAWIKAVKQTLPAVCRHFWRNLVQDANRVAAVVAKATPPLEHVFTGNTYVANLAKKHVLGWPARQELSEHSVLLWRSMAAANKAQEVWGVSFASADDTAASEQLTMARNVFDAGRRAILAIAALNVIHELRGPMQTQKAAGLLNSKRADLPKALVGPLEKLAAAVIPAKAEEAASSASTT